MSVDAKRRRRGGGRAGNAERRGTSAIAQMPWNPPIMTDPPVEPLSEEGVQAIHNGAMRILEEIGIEFLNPEALEVLRASGGCDINGENVRMGRDFVMETIALAPQVWTITPRNPAHTLTIGGNHLNFGNVSSPPSYWDMGLGRKVTGTREMCANLLKLSQYFNCIHFIGGYPVEPQDIHASIRHLDVLYDKLTLTDKVAHAYCLGKERVEDVMEMVRIAAGLTDAEFEARPHMYTNINSTSPLKHDHPMLDGWMRVARRNQGLVVTPFTLAGAMAPVTMAGAVAQSLAEALCRWFWPSSCAPGRLAPSDLYLQR
jgi:trimethylamine--corrinoid protein Co-methyltransferase